MSTSSHAQPLSMYFAVFFALFILTGVTVAVAYVDLGALNDAVAMAIATTKALLVLLFFMHVRASPGLTKVAIVTGVFWFAVMVLFMYSDIATRGLLGFPGT